MKKLIVQMIYYSRQLHCQILNSGILQWTMLNISLKCLFLQNENLIDVLCFVPNDYELFGFFWFEITEITVREMCFFGDFCIAEPSIYANTEYATGGGVFIDEAAIFEIRARHQVGDGPLVDMVGTDFNNMDWNGIGEPLMYPIS